MKKTYEACLQTHVLTLVLHEVLCLVGSLSELCLCGFDVPLHLLLYFLNIKEFRHLLPWACNSSDLLLFKVFLVIHTFLLLFFSFFVKYHFILLDNTWVKRIIFFRFFNGSKILLLLPVIIIMVVAMILKILELRIFVIIKNLLIFWEQLLPLLLRSYIVMLMSLMTLVVEKRDRLQSSIHQEFHLRLANELITIKIALYNTYIGIVPQTLSSFKHVDRDRILTHMQFKVNISLQIYQLQTVNLWWLG